MPGFRSGSISLIGNLLPSGQIDVEEGAAALRILEADRAAQPGDDLLDDAEPEPGAAFAARVGGVGLREFLEYVRRKSAGIPGPWSRTEMRIRSPCCVTATTTSPSRGENLMAFDSRLVTTWASRSGSACTSPATDAGSSRNP